MTKQPTIRSSRRIRRATCEMLEPRRMLFSTSLDGGVLTVNADLGDKYLAVDMQNGQLAVEAYHFNGFNQTRVVDQRKTFDPAAVANLRLLGTDFDDSIRVMNDVTIPTAIHGGNGHDRLQGGGGPTSIWGYGNIPGNPRFDVEHYPPQKPKDNDTLLPGTGATHMYGQIGDDFIGTVPGSLGSTPLLSVFAYGGAGDDLIQIAGDGLFAFAFGGDGNDTFVFIEGVTKPATILGGAGVDAVSFYAWNGPVRIDLRGTGYLSGPLYGTRNLTLGNDIENATGGFANDVIYGNVLNNELSGGNGRDTIFAGAGNDGVNGDDGDDMLFGEAGEDVLKGGRGNDYAFGGAGSDTLFGEFNALVSPTDGHDVLYGEDGDDNLYGGGGNDTMYGGAGNDHFWSVDGVFGNDRIYGGSGNDIAYIDIQWNGFWAPPVHDLLDSIETVYWI